MHDLTQVRQAGLVELLALTPGVTLLADAGYQGLSTQTAGAVITLRPARRDNQIPVVPAVAAAHEAECRAHAAKRIHVEHGVSHLKNWRALFRHPRPTRAPRRHPARGRRPGLQPGASTTPEPLHRPPRALPTGTTA